MDGGYSALVSRVLKNDVLVAAAKQMSEPETKAPTLNLVTNNWETVIDNDLFLQGSKFPFERKPSVTNVYNFEASSENLLNVTLVGNCRFTKPLEGKTPVAPSVIIAQSDPLIKLATIMTRDVQEEVEISEDFKFNFKECSVLTCSPCKESHAVFTKKGYALNRFHQPCICVTKVFDGENIYNRFYSFLENAFSQNFIAVLHLKINSRYSYTDKTSNRKLYRISGTVTDFVAFNEAKLDFVNPIDIGDLSPFEMAVEIPSKDTEPVKDGKASQKSLKNEMPSMDTSHSLGEIFAGSGIPENEFNLAKESEKRKMTTELAVGDDISMVKKVKPENENHDDSKRPRVEEEFLSIEGV